MPAIDALDAERSDEAHCSPHAMNKALIAKITREMHPIASPQMLFESFRSMARNCAQAALREEMRRGLDVPAGVTSGWVTVAIGSVSGAIVTC
ncbi:hypothetical protein [Salipiger thiooxidans]|uniref:hypothetical protein n=1 Tax=Salipiger thiooxidans TaxID=282683 RepID=UPI001CD519C5|nr:hypothetical protein [Salipiger thiooxidans]MCA0849664.1 hypothetical protein [Salipiger thiooxidans]